MQKNISIYHCPTSVGGNPQGLSRAEKLLGLKSLNVVENQNYLNYDIDKVLFTGGEGKLKRTYIKIKCLVDIIKNYDVVHFNSGTTFFPMRLFVYDNMKTKCLRVFLNVLMSPLVFWDMKLLKVIFKKKIYVTYQGSDARQNDMLESLFEYNVLDEIKNHNYSKNIDKYKRHNIKNFEKYADKIFSVNPDLMHVLPQKTKFVGYSHVFTKDLTSKKSNKKLLISHAPTSREIKGSKYIFEVINSLKDLYEFEFKLIEGMSNREAQEWYKKSDLVIDQLFLGWYGGLAVEAMSFGTPVMCYLRESDFIFLPEGMAEDIPIINVNKYNLKEKLEEILKNSQSLSYMREKSYNYVKKWHNPKINVKKIYSIN